jgi:hypothetical protein
MKMNLLSAVIASLLCLMPVTSSAWGDKAAAVIKLKEIEVTVTTAKLTKDGHVEVFLSLKNLTGKDLWVIPARNASATDDAGASYKFAGSTGFTRVGIGAMADMPLYLPAEPPGMASFEFTPEEKGGKPSKISVRATLLISDKENESGHSVGLNLLDLPVKAPKEK